MKPFPSEEENKAAMEAAYEARRRLDAGDWTDEEERQRLEAEAWPWASRYARTPEGRLSVAYCPDFGGVLLYDYSGFLTSVMTKETLWEILQQEAEAPGFTRERLRRPRRERPISPAEWREMQADFIAKHGVTRPRKPAASITLADLGINFD